MTELTPTYTKAVELNNKIIASAQIAQKSIYDIANGLKTMRDEKLYKELGYQNFEEYCETETGISRRWAYKYIQILENVSPGTQNIGTSKLYLLSTLTDDEQKQIADTTDLESITKRELEAKVSEIKELKKKNENLSDTIDTYNENIERLKGEVATLKKVKEELEARPLIIEAQEDDSYHLNDKKLAETIASLERNNIEQNEKLAAQYEQSNKREIQKLEAEHKKELEAVNAQYKAKVEELAAAKSEVSAIDDKEVFKAYYTTAYDSLNRLIEYANKKANVLYVKKIHELLDKSGESIAEVE